MVDVYYPEYPLGGVVMIRVGVPLQHRSFVDFVHRRFTGHVDTSKETTVVNNKIILSAWS